jgi:cytidylate kinase
VALMKTVRVITISREYGSGGAAIGQELAGRLGWKLLDRELILEMSRRAHVQPSVTTKMDEHPTPFIALLLKGFWHGNEYTWSGPGPEVIDPDSIAQLSAMVIHEAARLGRCVIVGRGGQCILQDHEDAFHVFVYGSLPRKLERTQTRHLTKTECEWALTDVDRTRATFIRRYYGCDWTDRRLYDLMISSDIGIAEASTAILAAAGLTVPEDDLGSKGTGGETSPSPEKTTLKSADV